MIDFPSNPANGDVFTSGNSSWVWNAAASQWRTAVVALNPNVQRLSGDGTTTQFTLNTIPPNTNFLDLYITGLYQQKNTYSISGTTLTFTEAPPAGTDNIEVEWGSTLDIGTPSDASVTAVKLSSTAITDKLGYTPVNKAGDTITGQLKVNGPLETISPTSKGVYSGYDPSNSNNIGIEVVSGVNGYSWLDFSDGNGSDFKGRIGYDNNVNRLDIGTNGVARITVDSSGRINAPYQPMFSGYRGTTPNTITAGNVVIHSSVVTDIGGCYNQSTGRFTCPIAGKYLVTICGHAENAQPVSHQIRKNGVFIVYEYGSIPSGNYTALSRTVILTCAANDYIDHYIGSGTFWCGDASGVAMTVILIG